MIVLLFPQCLAGPYAAVDPFLVERWLSAVGEALPLPTGLHQQPVYIVSATIPALIALGVTLYAAWRARGADRAAWLILLAFFVVVMAVACIQVRGLRISVALIAPAAAWLIVTARAHYLRRVSAASVLGLVGAWLGMAGLVWAVLVAQALNVLPAQAANDDGPGASATCLAPDAYADLAGLPPERIMTPHDMGAFMLLYTPHAVVSAPYHRNNQGLLDTYRFLNGPIDDARRILQARGISLVVTCDPMPEMAGQPDAAPDSFVRLAKEGTLPDWLDNVSTSGPLNVYQVRPADPQLPAP